MDLTPEDLPHWLHFSCPALSTINTVYSYNTLPVWGNALQKGEIMYDTFYIISHYSFQNAEPCCGCIYDAMKMAMIAASINISQESIFKLTLHGIWTCAAFIKYDTTGAQDRSFNTIQFNTHNHVSSHIVWYGYYKSMCHSHYNNKLNTARLQLIPPKLRQS